MIIIESSELIGRPADQVFAFVSDIRNDPQWHTDILDAEYDASGPAGPGPGATFHTRFKPFMGQTEGTGTVTVYEPPRRVVLTSQMGNMKPVLTLTVEPDAGGSRITRRLDMEPTGMLRIVAPFTGGMMRKHNAGFLTNLKRVLEADNSEER
ncbi:SRPBCC family protein [Arthrobacter rhizosphaerae]|uniref:SRPBCC family protein n=1 Tax=Arthrobacter rhizosphaerae TaxID=2855490 RepID=UPI001FF66839|nr:SRPBCC family protein [Arthrobacter rhizosphaerae]